MKAEEIRQLIDSELEERLVAERMRLHDLRMSHAVSPLENTMQLREAKRTIARILTIQGERARGEAKGSEEKK